MSDLDLQGRLIQGQIIDFLLNYAINEYNLVFYPRIISVFGHNHLFDKAF
jgi:flagellar biosynthesis protein FliQ